MFAVDRNHTNRHIFIFSHTINDAACNFTFCNSFSVVNTGISLAIVYILSKVCYELWQCCFILKFIGLLIIAGSMVFASTCQTVVLVMLIAR